MKSPNYYKILGVTKKASQEDIKKAYRMLVKQHHPDVNSNSAAAHKKIQEINEAYEVLINPEKRKVYDQQTSQPRQAKSSKQYEYSHYYSESFEEDIFEYVFGQSKTKSKRKARGEDYEMELKVNLTDIYTAHSEVLNIDGKNVRIIIPAGVEDGQAIKIKGYGGVGLNGGVSGDLYIHFSIINNTSFRLSGNDLYTTLDIDLYTAVLGGELTVNVIDGKVKLKINAGTQSGTKVRLKGKGMPVYKKEGMFGDLYVTLHVKLPVNLTEKQKELFRKLAKM